ncbi:hypothetical protein [Halobacterium salinarum]|uniref:hypothetical protein n=1 Tax=Halobacterium salinarum TaxID=2242 RepID=UPI001F38D7BB|nr:hypothetical protein [Halobacterium salinarum]
MAHLVTLEDTDDTSTDSRHEKARTEEMIVDPEVIDGFATGLYTIHSSSGSTYTVDLDTRPPCNCPDMEYNAPENGCKHFQRVQMMLDETPLPAPDESAEDYLAMLADARTDLLDALDSHEERAATLTHLVGAAENALDS